MRNHQMKEQFATSFLNLKQIALCINLIIVCWITMECSNEEISMDSVSPIDENFALLVVQQSDMLFNFTKAHQSKDDMIFDGDASKPEYLQTHKAFICSPLIDTNLSQIDQKIALNGQRMQTYAGVKHSKNKQSKRIGKTPKNDTKNIPKNFGKAIIAFILKKQISVEKILAHHKVEYESLSAELGQMKKKVNTIADLRKLWMGHRYSKCLRLLSDFFLRKLSMHYIFNSRVWNYKSHIKYRTRMREALNFPEGFNYIKDF